LGRALIDLLDKIETEYVGLSRQKTDDLTFVSDYSEAPVGDVLVHLAQSNDINKVNALGSSYELESLNLLRELADKGYGKIIYASSAILYGDKATTPRTESDSLFVRDTYTRVKHRSEEIVLSKNGTILRLSNLYGEKMSNLNVMSAILRQVQSTGTITLKSISPIRDFLWIEDAAAAIRQIILHDLGGVYNIGSGVGISIGALTNQFLEVVNQRSRHLVTSNAKENPSRLVLDISKITQATSWRPLFDLREGISRLLNN
jgi:UDP-glucose 4-epimerase